MYRINRNREARAFLRGLGLIGLWIVMIIVSWALVVGAVTALFTLTAAPAAADTEVSEQNDPAFWGDDCDKSDQALQGPRWTADTSYRLVVLKAGTENFQFHDVQPGDVLTTGNGKDVSHVIRCGRGPTDTVCHEDMPCWNCETMGNLVCGPPDTTTTTTRRLR